MTTRPELDMEACCLLVLQHSPDPYAETYARAWLDGKVQERAAEYGSSLEQAMRVQANYIVSNLTGWGGPVATQVRDSLRRLGRAK